MVLAEQTTSASKTKSVSALSRENSCMQKFSAFVTNCRKFWQYRVPNNSNLCRDHGRRSHPLNRSYQGSLNQKHINHGRITTTIKGNGINNKDRGSIYISKGHSITSNPSGWLVGCFGLNGPLRQYFSLYRAVSQREVERREVIDERKIVQTTPTRPLPYCNPNWKTPQHWKFTQHHRTTRSPPCNPSGLVGFFGFYGPLRQCIGRRSISGRLPKRGRKRRERIDENKNVQTTPTRTYCKCSRPLSYCNSNCRTPRHWKFTQHHRTTQTPQTPVEMQLLWR